jgi:hypothetical protein
MAVYISVSDIAGLIGENYFFLQDPDNLLKCMMKYIDQVEQEKRMLESLQLLQDDNVVIADTQQHDIVTQQHDNITLQHDKLVLDIKRREATVRSCVSNAVKSVNSDNNRSSVISEASNDLAKHGIDIKEKELSGYLNKKMGQIKEDSVCDAATLLRKLNITGKQVRFCLSRETKHHHNNILYKIGGKVDAIENNDTIVEFKYRVKELHKYLAKYERIQVMFYMYISSMKKNGILVQSNDSETKHHEIVWSETEILCYLSKLDSFVAKLYEFVNSDAYIQFLNSEPEVRINILMETFFGGMRKRARTSNESNVKRIDNSDLIARLNKKT